MIALAAMGAIFLTGRPGLVRYAVWFGLVFCLADWALVEDLGFLGGLGTDPNSMIPWILLFTAGYLALTPAPEEERAVAADGHGWRERLRMPAPSALGTMFATASARSVAAVAALGIILIGAAPMAAASVNRTADPILALAIAGNSSPEDYQAPGFQLTDQNGRPVSLASLRGKVVLMTFLDPVCTSDCPIIGAEMKEAGVLLGSADKDVELVAIVANPIYRSVAFTQAFDREEGLNTVPNWLYLTGSLSQLTQVWRQYGVAAEILPAGAMVDHSDLALVIDRTGHIRQEVGADPGPGTASTQSSFSVLLSQYARNGAGRAHDPAGRRPRATERGPGLPGRGLWIPDRPGHHSQPAGADRAAVHLAGHRAGRLGGHGHGRAGGVGEQLLAAVRPARGRQPLVPGHPGGRGRQRRAGRGRAARAAPRCWSGSGPARA